MKNNAYSSQISFKISRKKKKKCNITYWKQKNIYIENVANMPLFVFLYFEALHFLKFSD